MTRSATPFLAGAIVLAALVFLLFLNRRPAAPSTTTPPKPATPRVTEPPKPVIPAMQPDPVDSAQSPLEALENAGLGARSSDPAQLLEQIGEALESGDFDAVGRLIGSKALTPEARQRLAALAADGNLKLRRPVAASEVGEIELNKRTRWALHIDGAEPGRDRIFFDLFNTANQWSVESVTLPPASTEPIPKAQLVDALGIADAFLQAALRQDFQMAKEFVSDDTVSDAKIAGLCILFEEGSYQLRPNKPLRAVFQRDDTAGFLAHALAEDGGDAAEFSITLRKAGDAADWKLAEINLDQLLADYARRIAGGDVYFTPLVKNPKGGDTLVLYFSFDENEVSPRSARQLDIVGEILKTDPGRKLTLSGHTDSLGSKAYNAELSAKRAAAVKRHLVASGVAEDQIITLAKGQTQPRRPNFTKTGEDNPDGRRANRRTEIYLDF